MNLAALGWYETQPNTTFFQKAHSFPRHPPISLLSEDTPEEETFCTNI